MPISFLCVLRAIVLILSVVFAYEGFKNLKTCLLKIPKNAAKKGQK